VWERLDGLCFAQPILRFWGCSSIGRAPALQAGGRRFDSVHLHQRIWFGGGVLIAVYLQGNLSFKLLNWLFLQRSAGGEVWMFAPSLIVGSRNVLCQGE
jgi:hypothetical protein